jgi:hypothetical protein
MKGCTPAALGSTEATAFPQRNTFMIACKIYYSLLRGILSFARIISEKQ